MKTYSAVWESGGFLFEKLPSNDLFSKIPAGARIVSGNVVDPKTGDILEERAVYKTGGKTFTIYQDKE